jgi:integrase
VFESSKVLLSDRYVANAAPPPTGERRIWDTRLSGFAVRIWPSGKKVFCVRFRRAKRTEMHTIGNFGDPWSTDQARAKATELLLRLSDGHINSRDKRTNRLMSVKELCERYLSEGPNTKITKRASSWKTDITNLRRHVQPLIGKRLVNDLTRSDIERLVRDVTDGVTAGDIHTKRQGVARVRGGAGSAARVKTTLAAMFNWAVIHELMDKNPAKGVQVAKTRKLERFLSDAEASKLLSTLADQTAGGFMNRQHADVIRLLLFTGARKSEVLGLRWSEVDLLRNRLSIPPERTKCGTQNGVRRIPLGTAAKDILGNIERTSEYVFPADRKGRSGHMTGIQKTWKRICEFCGLGNMRLHDLRHSFASFAIANGESIFVISNVLGHSTTRMTERYLHLRDEDVRGLAERTTQRIVGSAARLRVVARA